MVQQTSGPHGVLPGMRTGPGLAPRIQLALDFESHSNRALLPRLGHHHPFQVLALREQVRVLQEAVDLLACHLVVGLFQWIFASLLP